MAYIRTLRGPSRTRQPSFVPGSLACAAARPFALSAAIRWAEPPAQASQTCGDHSSAGASPAASLTDDRS